MCHTDMNVRAAFCKLVTDPALECWLEVALEDYRYSVEVLLKAAEMSGTSGARVASILLLSLFNGSAWHMDLTDLCLLSGTYYAAALVAIRGRKELACEPHRVIANGDEVFSALWDNWSHLKVQN